MGTQKTQQNNPFQDSFVGLPHVVMMIVTFSLFRDGLSECFQ